MDFENEKIKFGKAIKYFRSIQEPKPWSLQKLADEANLEKATLHRIEQGKVNFTFKTILSIADALKVSPSDFFNL